MRKFLAVLVLLFFLPTVSIAKDESPTFLKYDKCSSVYGGAGKCWERAKGYFHALGYRGTLYDMEFAYLGDLGYTGTLWDRWNAFLGAQGATGSIRDRFAGTWSLGDTLWATFSDPSNPLALLKGTGSLSFTRATTATYIHPTTGLITSAASGQLRIESNGALIEGARTNIALQSEVLGTTWAASSVTIANDDAVAPDGASTAERLTASGANGTLLQSVTGTAAAYTFSIYLKRLTGTGNVDVRADNTTWSTCTINASTWTRCPVTATLADNTYAPGVRIVTSGDAVYAFGGQMEAGASASSYITTTIAAVTRNVDLLSFSKSGNVSDTAGTIVASVGSTNGTGATSYTGIIMNSATQPLSIYQITKLYSYDGTTELTTEMGLEQGVHRDVGLKWSGTSRYFGAKGALSAALAFDGNMGFENTLYIGVEGDGQFALNGHIKNLRIWNRALGDAEMIAVTQ